MSIITVNKVKLTPNPINTVENINPNSTLTLLKGWKYHSLTLIRPLVYLYYSLLIAKKAKLTSKLGQVVVLAEESRFVDHVQFLSGGQLLTAGQTRETLEVVDPVSGPSHQLRG